MHLRYRIDDFASITVKLFAPISAITCPRANSIRPRLIAPSKVAAHDTISGWCDFIVKPDIIGGHTIDGYQIVLTDSHQGAAAVEPLVVSEKRHAV